MVEKKVVKMAESWANCLVEWKEPQLVGRTVDLLAVEWAPLMG